METIDEKIHIEAPVGEVYTFVTDPGNWPAFVTHLSEIRDLSSPHLEPGTTFSWHYACTGGARRGTGHVNQNVVNAKFSMSIDGNFEVTEAYTFTPVGAGTDLSVKISPLHNGGDDLNRNALAREILSRVKSLCEDTRH